MGLLIIYWGWCPGIFLLCFYCGANAKHGKFLQGIDMNKQIVNLRITMWNARIITREISEYVRGLRGFLLGNKYGLQENSLWKQIPIYKTYPSKQMVLQDA